MRRILSKVAHSYRDIPNKKPYIEFFAALLSIPVLLTVILLNLNALRGDKNTKTTSTATPPQKIFVTIPNSKEQTNVVQSQNECTPKIGPISITSPAEKEVITNNPVSVNINYQQNNFCSVVWSYRINNGQWSDYDDKSIALYNPPSGNIKLELRIKSVVNDESETLARNFVYSGNNIVSTTPSASSSAN